MYSPVFDNGSNIAKVLWRAAFNPGCSPSAFQCPQIGLYIIPGILILISGLKKVESVRL